LDEFEDDVPKRRSGEKIPLAAFLGNGTGYEAPTISASTFIIQARSTLSELNSARLNSSGLESLVEECGINTQRTLDFIENGDVAEEVMAQLLSLLDDLNTTLI